MKPIDFGISDLPSDFRLGNYDVCPTWGAEEWWQALTHRYAVHLYSQLPVEDYTESAEEAADAIKFSKECSLLYFSDPLPIIGDEDRVHPVNGTRSPIRDLTGSDFYLGLYNLDEQGYEVAAELAKKVAKRTGIMDARDVKQQGVEVDALRAMAALDLTPAWQIHRDANRVGDKFWIEVELGASDDELVKEFKDWLRQIRKAADIPRIPKRFDSSHFKDWCSKRLLPYLDLTLWARAHGGAISASLLGYILFPDEPLRDARMRNIEPMIRRTIAPQARQLVTWQVVNTLYRQVHARPADL